MFRFFVCVLFLFLLPPSAVCQSAAAKPSSLQAISQSQAAAFCDFSQGWCENCTDPCSGECGAECDNTQTYIISINASSRGVSKILDSFSCLNTLVSL